MFLMKFSDSWMDHFLFCLFSRPHREISANMVSVVGFTIGKAGSHLGKTLENLSQMCNCHRASSQAGATVPRTSPCAKPFQSRTEHF